MRKFGLVMIAAGLLLATALSAAAKEARALDFKRLNGAEISSLLLGTEIAGKIHGRTQSWNGCIDPDGVTSREIDGAYITGQFSVRDDLACFAYEDAESCFLVLQYEGGHMLYSGRTDFLIDQIKSDVEACPSASAGV